MEQFESTISLCLIKYKYLYICFDIPCWMKTGLSHSCAIFVIRWLLVNIILVTNHYIYTSCQVVLLMETTYCICTLSCSSIFIKVGLLHIFLKISVLLLPQLRVNFFILFVTPVNILVHMLHNFSVQGTGFDLHAMMNSVFTN